MYAVVVDEAAPNVEEQKEQGLHGHKNKPLSLLPLIALIFFDVSGGPFGTEDAVSAGGPLLVILGFIILPFVWSVPEALITAELATTFPENSGYVAWVTAAFGPFWGFQEGFWSWLSGVTDNSIYPVMFADNLVLLFPALAGGWPRTIFVMTLSLSLTYMNYRGLTVVGNTVVATTAFILIPFVILSALCVPHISPANWLVVDWPTVQWGTFLNIMFWNLNYWDSVSTLAGEVHKPQKTFPKALLWAVVVVVLSYLVPTMAALGVSTDTDAWTLGYYGQIADQIGGRWLAVWILAAAAASNIGQFQAEMSSDAYQLQGMAERGFLPSVLGRRSRHGTPTLGILLSSLGVLTLSSFNFTQIVELLNAIYCLAELLEFAAVVYLRYKAPDLPRPYKIPLPAWGVALMLTPATVLLVVLLVLPVVAGNWVMVGWTVGALVAGFVLYPLLQMARERRWCEFADLQFDSQHPLLQPGGQRGGTRGSPPGTPLLRPPPQAGGLAGASPRHSLSVDAANGVGHGHGHSHGHSLAHRLSGLSGAHIYVPFSGNTHRDEDASMAAPLLGAGGAGGASDDDLSRATSDSSSLAAAAAGVRQRGATSVLEEP